MTDLTVTRYSNINVFLKETEAHLQQQEIENTLVLATAYRIQKERHNNNNATFCYCGAVWSSKHDLIFVLVGQDNALVYPSSLFDMAYPEAITLLSKDLFETSINIQGMHGYQPALNMLRDSIETIQPSAMTFVQKLVVSSYVLKRHEIQWSCRSREIAHAKSTSLRLASASDLSILQQWTSRFIQDAFEDPSVITMPVDTITQEMIASNGLYLLCIDDKPVSMAWKLRPLRYGASLGYVYTPPEYRNKGYGAACVTMTSEAILKEYSYIALFMDIKQDPNDNLYSRVGYKYFGKACKLGRPT